tara:strand:- start:177 stop:941 length:765 start_codon:yes stop_codon:yes gene_type:complete
MISIIIVNYNSSDYLEQNLLSIENSKLQDVEKEILVFDNNSKYKPDRRIIDKYNAFYYQNDVNIGYSKALNCAIEMVKGDYILILNPDVILKSNSVQKLYNYYIENKIGVLGSKVLNNDFTFQLSSRRRFPYFRYFFPYLFKMNSINYYNYCDLDKNLISEVESISGCCMFFSRKIYNIVNGFDERFFLYFEDTDFCIKVKESGYKVIYFPESEILHAKYGSRNYLNYMYVKYHFYKSFFLFFKKYFYYYIHFK